MASFTFSSDTTTTDAIVSDIDVAGESVSKKKNKYILITNGESYVGHTLALFIADELERREGQLKKKHWLVRVLCQDRNKLKDLEKKGIEVKQVDYESQAMIREQMKDHIKIIIFNPFTESARLVSQGKNLIDAAVNEKIKRIMMISALGCSFYQDKETPIGQFNLLEEHLRKSYNYGAWIVFRIPLIQQFMYFWSSMIENKSVIGMPISVTNFLVTVNVKDICECVSQAALSKKSMVWNNNQQVSDNRDTSTSSSDNTSSNETDEENDQVVSCSSNTLILKRVYELKSTIPMTLGAIAKSLSDALKEEGFCADVKPAVLTDEQLESYLKLLSKEDAVGKIDEILGTVFPDLETTPASKTRRNALGGSGSGLFYNLKSIFISGGDSGQGLVSSRPSHDQEDDPNWYPYPSEFLTPFCIKLILDHFKVARSCAEFPILPTTNDIRDITGREPVQITEFFMNNRRQFRPEFQ